MKKILKIIAIVLVVGVIGIQFVRPARTNPQSDPKLAIEANAKVPPDVAKILTTSCKDCHSNKTVWPWYSNVAPFSWFLIDHVNDGRRELNFSDWGKYTERRRNHKLKELCEQVESHEMPHPQYLWIHWDAVLNDGQIKTLCNWSKGIMTEAAKSSGSDEKGNAGKDSDESPAKER